eukprot:CAMPEP_0180530414 /NCGR_PEP_ID=MMETSP1036_2-20121128/61920_1 /TAXON_ID=632150 /ORGANISM="Azadinium spinosum, Strain 3D9" /LENGTH=52 /DNA_ID=CAMNT_0022544241 /DNA_START=66 /DNA_END=221 /DNA_ORIENTATION=+
MTRHQRDLVEDRRIEGLDLPDEALFGEHLHALGPIPEFVEGNGRMPPEVLAV